MASEQFSLCWDNFHKNMSSGMQSLLESEDLVDVTLAVEGRYLKAHKMVLSVCSPYFRELFQSNPCKHPIVFMKDVSYIALSDLLQFMYQGEVQVAQENLTTFIKTAEALQIKGLTGDSNNQNESDTTETPEIEKPAVETIKRSHEVVVTKPVPTARVKKPAGPASKRPRFILPPAESSSAINPVAASTPVATTTKAEVSSATAVPTSDEIIQFKMEPTESADQAHVEGIDDSHADRYGDESTIDDMQDDTEDYSLMETGDDEPKAGTSADGMGDGQGVQWYDMYEYKRSSSDENLPSDVEEAATKVISDLVPEKSRLKYELTYDRYEKWCKEKKVKDMVNEKALLAYFDGLSKIHKPSSLWCYYSMIRAELSVKKNVDLKKYTNLIAFLKRKSKGYKANKSKVLTTEDVRRFLRDMDNEKFLMVKVVLIFGVAGACKREELTNLLHENVRDEGDCFRILIPDTQTKISREFFVTSGDIEGVDLLEIVRQYIKLRPDQCDHNRFFMAYRNGKCTRQPVGIHTIGSVPRLIAQFLELPEPKKYTAQCFRRSSMSLSANSGAKLVTVKREGGY